MSTPTVYDNRLMRPFFYTSFKYFFSTLWVLWFGSSCALAGSMPHPDHIVLVIEENKDFAQVAGKKNAPFINQSLIKDGLLYVNSFGIEHPSQPNYLDLFSGSNQGVSRKTAKWGHGRGSAIPLPQNYNPPVNIPFTTPNLASLLRDKKTSFVEYSEGLSNIVGMLDKNGNVVLAVMNDPADRFQEHYARRHDPVANWMSDQPQDHQLTTSTEQDFTRFKPKAENFTHLPAVSFVIPDTHHDMHDGEPEESITDGDNWLKDNLSNYLAWAKTHNSLLIITMDENDSKDPANHILTVINGDSRLFQTGTSQQKITHFDLLRTIEDIYQTGYAGESKNASGLKYANGKFIPFTPAFP